MRRRRKANTNYTPESDHYTPSMGHSSMGNSTLIGGAAGGLNKHNSQYSGSEFHSQHSQPMQEANPLDRYIRSGGGTVVPTPATTNTTSYQHPSRVSDISSQGSASEAHYRPYPGAGAGVAGMAAVAEQQRPLTTRNDLPYPIDSDEVPHELPSEPARAPYDYTNRSPGLRNAEMFLTPGTGATSRPGGDTPSNYSGEADRDRPSNEFRNSVELPADSHPQHTYQQVTTSNTDLNQGAGRLELSGESAVPGGSGGAGYRGVDPEQPLHQRTHLTKNQQGGYGPSYNF